MPSRRQFSSPSKSVGGSSGGTNKPQRLSVMVAVVFAVGLSLHIAATRQLQKGGLLSYDYASREDTFWKVAETTKATDEAPKNDHVDDDDDEEEERDDDDDDDDDDSVRPQEKEAKKEEAKQDKGSDATNTGRLLQQPDNDKDNDNDNDNDKNDNVNKDKKEKGDPTFPSATDAAYRWNSEGRIRAWDGNDGDALNAAALKDRNPHSVVESMRRAASEHYVFNLETHRVDLVENAPSHRPLQIAIACGATSHTLHNKVFMDMALGRILLPSVAARLEPDRYRYALYVSVDQDDAFWQSASNIQRLERLALPAHLPLYVYAYPQKSPKRIPFNEVARQAYWDGADYFVRVNDDTEFITEGWTSLAISTLLHYAPPNIGMVGPSCSEGNTNIMTHDLVYLEHHLKMFQGHYYPTVYTNWYVDDWISAVYGPMRTLQHSGWMVSHRIGHHGQRYREDSQASPYLQEWIWAGRQAMYHYMCHEMNPSPPTRPNREWIQPLLQADEGKGNVGEPQQQQRRLLRAVVGDNETSWWSPRPLDVQSRQASQKDPALPHRRRRRRRLASREDLRPRGLNFKAPHYEDRFLLDSYVTQVLSPKGQVCGATNVLFEYRETAASLENESVSYFMETVLQWNTIWLMSAAAAAATDQQKVVCTQSSSSSSSSCQALASLIQEQTQKQGGAGTNIVVVLQVDSPDILRVLWESVLTVQKDVSHILVSGAAAGSLTTPTQLVSDKAAWMEFCQAHKSPSCSKVSGVYTRKTP